MPNSIGRRFGLALNRDATIERTSAKMTAQLKAKVFLVLQEKGKLAQAV